MAARGADPVMADPQVALAALEEHLPKALRGVPFELSGWQRPDPLTLFVPVWGLCDGPPDLFLLRLNFAYYPEWPPSAKFINPITKAYDHGSDLKWLPKIENHQRIQVHALYNNQTQLICSSTTLEFYLVRHGVEARDLWDAQSQNFSSTLNAVRDGLQRHTYRGRMG
jgi:hypothetical protein